MNKNKNYFSSGNVYSLKNFLVNIMRIFFLLITMGLSSAFATTSKAQTKIDITVTNVSLETLFEQIQKKSEFIFFYKDNVINYNVSLNLKEATVSKILDIALKDTNLTYKFNERQIVISQKLKKPQNLDTKNSQQQLKINGKVFDEDGYPLEGASIRAKGSSTGVTSDLKGRFSYELLF